MIKLVLKGRPITKKTGQRKFRNVILQKQSFIDYEKSCQWQINIWRKGMETIKSKIHLQVHYYMPDKTLPDLINLLQGTCDILQNGRVISNDRNIISFDNSRIIGVDKEDPRCEIEIEEVK